jgi:hypothetical protein
MKGGGAWHEPEPTDPTSVLDHPPPTADKLHAFEQEFQSLLAVINNIDTRVILLNLHAYYSESNLPPDLKWEACLSASQILVKVYTEHCMFPCSNTPGRGCIGMARLQLVTMYTDIQNELNALYDILHRYMSAAYGLRKIDTVRRKFLTLTAPIRHFFVPPPEEEKPMSLKLLIESKFRRILEMRLQWLSQHAMLRSQINL